MYRLSKALSTWLILMLVLLPCFSVAQDKALLSKQQLEQMVAPIALYPDPLLAQILMASTYPLDIVNAARWVKEHPKLKDKALEDALQNESWDPSVKSLTAVPEVLNMMNDKLDMTTQLGNAFLSQQKDVLDAIQALRAKAEANGNLKSSKQQIVKSTPAGPDQTSTNYITIEQVEPDVVYVPVYNPVEIYGEWPYPDYLPFDYYPVGYNPVGALLGFGAAIAVGGALWGAFDWGHHDVNINANRYNSFNRTNINNGIWQHNAVNRDAIQRNEARDAFRNQAEQGRSQIQKGGQGAIQRMEQQGSLKEQGLNKANKLDKQNKQAQGKAANRNPKANTNAINNAKQSRNANNRGTNKRSQHGNNNAVHRDKFHGHTNRSKALSGTGQGRANINRGGSGGHRAAGGGQRMNSGGGHRAAGGGGHRGGGGRKR